MKQSNGKTRKVLEIHLYLDGISVKEEGKTEKKTYDYGNLPKMEANGIYLTVDSDTNIVLLIDGLKEIKEKIKLLGWYPEEK